MRLIDTSPIADQREISIHAPLAGCDSSIRAGLSGPGYFNPRTPCGVRHKAGNQILDHIKFQSTHPLRGATLTKLAVRYSKKFQSTHPLRGATYDRDTHTRTILFQSTHPLRGATGADRIDPLSGKISIHAPLAGCDSGYAAGMGGRTDFNPRTPCGVRQRKCTKFSAHFAITDNSIGFPRPECRLLGHFLLIPGACSARERVRTFL